jgi:HprK-related kinase A
MGRVQTFYRTGPFTVGLSTSLGSLTDLVRWFYRDSILDGGSDLILNFDVAIDAGPWFRRLIAPQATFSAGVETPFEPFPRDHAFPLLEWGLNWCTAMRAHRYLMLHAGVLERDGRALVLPAVPGSGKSTLTAALALSGWRLFADEFGLLDWRTGLFHPMPRAIALKNESIEIIRRFSSEAALGPTFRKTRKGDVSHLRPPARSLQRQLETARPGWVVFPRFVPGSKLQLEHLPKHLAFTRLSQNAFNYALLGAQGFSALNELITSCGCWGAQFGDLESILTAIDRLPAPAP